MASRSAGVSGVAVTLAGAGLFAVYAGIRDVPLLDGLRAALKGDDPSSLARTTGKAYTGPSAPSAPSSSSSGPKAQGFTFAGPVSVDKTVAVPAAIGTIRVHASIADDVTRLLAAAKAAGVNLSGWGWRSMLQQRALRLQHGYPNDQTPSGAGGRLPVARPGTSRHEAGLAIDFHVNNVTIKRESPAFRWLAANAAAYGLHNLPSEPWHWSTDGK